MMHSLKLLTGLVIGAAAGLLALGYLGGSFNRDEALFGAVALGIGFVANLVIGGDND